MKKLLSIAVAICMTMAMTVPALAANTAANVNDTSTEVDAPGTKGTGYDGTTNTQLTGQSYGEATVTTGDAGATWDTANDDDNDNGLVDNNGTDIYVWAKVTGDGATLYKVDIAWGAMKFEFSGGDKTWDVTSHTYTSGGGSATKEWVEATYLDNVNNKIDITNHSNCGITATFAYAMEQNGGNTMFNDSWVSNKDAVMGNFFKDNTDAIAASEVLEDILNASDGTPNNSTIEGLVLKNRIWNGNAYVDDVINAIDLPTADHFNTGGNDWTIGNNKSGSGYDNEVNNVTNGARTRSINFAFSGTPDAGRGTLLNTFKKVGIISVTVEPNLDAALNTAPAITP